MKPESTSSSASGVQGYMHNSQNLGTSPNCFAGIRTPTIDGLQGMSELPSPAAL